MTATVGVLCGRVRVEEKQVMAALAEAGALPMPLPPASVALPIHQGSSTVESDAIPAGRLIDRCADRDVAAAVLTICRSIGVLILDAGLAASSDRLGVATALAAATLPRPETRLCCSAEAALFALDGVGYPATLLPLRQGSGTTPLLDRDGAEAVLEHREVLGESRDALALVQAGVPAPSSRATVVVIDGQAMAVSGPTALRLPDAAISMAEQTARALDAAMLGVVIVAGAGGLVVWDVVPVPEFRNAVPLGHVTVAAAIARMAVVRLKLNPQRQRVDVPLDVVEPGRPTVIEREVGDGIVLTA